jgi:CelD/BcsL family acetyltransferase involved in cellulose biosynthesis
LEQSPHSVANRSQYLSMPPSLAVPIDANSPSSAAATDFVLCDQSIGALSEAELAAWQRLARESDEPNPFQSPAFILAACRSGLASATEVRIISLRERQSNEWAVAGAFLGMAPSLSRPLARLRALSTRYSYLDTPLVSRRHGVGAATEFLRRVAASGEWHGCRFPTLVNGGVFAEGVLASTRGGQGYHLSYRSWNRAGLALDRLAPGDLLKECSKVRRKSLQRAWSRLSRMGRVEFRLTRPAPGDDRPLETFLELEHHGWKRAQGTSLLSSPRDAAFARAALSPLAETGELLFGELRVGDRVIASTCNLLAGSRLYAFKIGWHPDYQAGSPGNWSELLLADAVRAQLPQIEWIDSCSAHESHLESLWPHSVELADMVCVWSRSAAWLAHARESLRFATRLYQRMSADIPCFDNLTAAD